MFSTLNAKNWRDERNWPESLVRLRGELNPWIDRLMQGGGDAPLSLWEDEQHIYVEVDMPGVAKDQLDLTFEQGRLRIAAERKPSQTDVKYVHNERYFGRLERSITLPNSIVPQAIEAQLENGVLRVQLTKQAEVLPKKIEVKVG